MAYNLNRTGDNVADLLQQVEDKSIYQDATQQEHGLMSAADKLKIDTAVPSAATTSPLMDGAAAVGTSTKYAREDHVHPKDTSKQDTLVSGTNIKTINSQSILGSGDLEVGSDIDTVAVSVDSNTGTPSATGSVSGSTLSLSFHNLKGATGPAGPQGPIGPQGNTGSSIDYPFTLINNLTEGGVDKALTAEQGKVLGDAVFGESSVVLSWDNGANVPGNNTRYYKLVSVQILVGDVIHIALSDYSTYNVAMVVNTTKNYSGQGGSIISDTTWQTSAITKTVSLSESGYYCYISIRKSNNGSITVSEAESVISELTATRSGSTGGILPRDNEPIKDSIHLLPSGKIYDLVNGKQPELNNSNLTGNDYGSYTVSGNTRGYITLPVQDNTEYYAWVSVKENSTVKYGIQFNNGTPPGNDISSIFDSGWLTAGNSREVNESVGSSSVKYIVIAATYVSGSTGIPTLSEFLSNADFVIRAGNYAGGINASIAALGQELETTKDDIQTLEDEVFGAVTIETTTEQNFDENDYTSYSGGGNTRGLLGWPIEMPFTFTAVMASNSPIKFGVQGRNSMGGSTNQYDSGWINANTTYTANMSDFTGLTYIAIAFTYVSGNTGVPTVAEIRQYFQFTYTRGVSLPSLREEMQNLYVFDKVGIIAHRGFHLNGIPENSIDAYRYAGFAKFEFAETDFCPTSDGKLVLMHDASINRTMRNKSDYSTISGTVNVNSKTLAELQAGYVLAAEDKRYRRTIPLLEDYFVTCKQYGVFPIPEIKQSGTTQENVKDAFDMGCSILGEGNFGFCSFSYSLLDYARTLSSQIPLYYIGSSILDSVNTITGDTRNNRLNIWYVNYTDSDVTAERIADYHSKGMQVAVWSVPVADTDAVIKKGVDTIASDCIVPALNQDNGEWIRSDVDFSAFQTTGVFADNVLTLSAGQSVSFTGELAWLGGYFLEIIAKGSFTVSAPNLSKTISSADIDTFRFMGAADNKVLSVTITASAATEIQFINFKIMKV